MENTSYGINVANRYDLFCIDDDAGDPMEAILKNKQKQQKKQQPAANAGATAAAATGTPAAAGAPQSQQPSSGQAKSAAAKGGEKENKSAGGRGAENRHPDKTAAQTNGTGNLHNQRGTERRGIKETQKDNIRNQENQKAGPGAAGAKFPRGPNNKNGTVAPGGGNDDKYPRKPREYDSDGQRKPYAQNGGGAGGAGGASGPKRFDGRGKRDFDRQSGSNKTGIKAVDKRDGAGSHNWGSSKQDAKEYSNLDQEYQPQDADTSADEKTNPERTNNVANGGEGDGAADAAAIAKAEEEAKEMTLDEWKAQKAAVRLKPQYNLRKAGEGEDSAQWDKMVALDRKSAKGEGAEGDDDENNDTQKASAGGKSKQVLEIEFHFNDNRRGGLGRSRGGRGGKGGGRGMGRDGPGGRGGRGGDFGGDNYRSGGGDYGYQQDGGTGGTNEGGMERPQRDNIRRNNRPPLGGAGGGGPERSYDGGMNKYSRPNPRASKQPNTPAAPKVDDEHAFPSLG